MWEAPWSRERARVGRDSREMRVAQPEGLSRARRRVVWTRVSGDGVRARVAGRCGVRLSVVVERCHPRLRREERKAWVERRSIVVTGGPGRGSCLVGRRMAACVA